MLPRGVAVSPALLGVTGGFTTLDGGDITVVLAVLLGSYLLGSVPAAIVVARRRHVDIRAVGDRNPGFWNTKETLGLRASVPVLVIDAAKGIAAAALGTAAARRLAGPLDATTLWSIPYLAGLAAMVGHAWPVFAGFRGGRCVLTFLGAWVVINPVELLVALALCRLLWAALRLTLWPISALVGDGDMSPGKSWRLMRGAVLRYVLAVILLSAPVFILQLVVVMLMQPQGPLLAQLAATPLNSLMALLAAAVGAEIYRLRVRLQPSAPVVEDEGGD